MPRRFKIFSRCEGAATVELALLLLPLMFLIGGVVDFGEAYYIKHIITNASREGTRYGVKYQVDATTGSPKAPSALSPSISDYIKLPAPTGLGYPSLLNSDANLTVSTPTLAGTNLTVTVTAEKHWFFLGGLLGFPDPQTLQASTTMALER